MLRRIVLSLMLLVSLLTMLPFATSLAHNFRAQSTVSHRSRHSRAWWRRHRARMRRRQSMLARRKQSLAAREKAPELASPELKLSDNHASLSTMLAFPENFYHEGSLALPLPSDWSPTSTRKDSSTFRVAAADGKPVGQATIAVVTAAAANTNQPIGREQRRMLGGVTFTDLRRTVIDRMLSAGGWVVNDREREVGGQRVFQVTAQTPASNDAAAQTWDFYFTEIDGRVYSLMTRSAGEFSDKLAADAETFLSSFRPMTNPPTAKK
jgi:hypothetical protein